MNLHSDSKRMVASMAAVLLALSGLFLNSTARAQCPSDVPPDSIAWNGPDTFIYADWGSYSHYCYDTVLYCTRLVNDTPEYVIDEIIVDTACDTTNWSNLIKYVSGLIFSGGRDQNCTPGLPPCPATPPYDVLEVNYADQCWSEYPYVGTSVYLNPCYASSYCKKIYALCCDLQMGLIGQTLLSAEIIGSPCSSSNPPPGSSNQLWEQGKCYYVLPCR